MRRVDAVLLACLALAALRAGRPARRHAARDHGAHLAGDDHDDARPDGVRHLKFRWGPVRIAPGQNTISLADNNLLPPGPGWITSFKPDLTYVDGKVPRVDVIHLHHAVWLVGSRRSPDVGRRRGEDRRARAQGLRLALPHDGPLAAQPHDPQPHAGGDAGLHHLGDGLHPARRQGGAGDARGQDAVARRRWAAAPTRCSTPSRARATTGASPSPTTSPTPTAAASRATSLARRPRRDARRHRRATCTRAACGPTSSSRAPGARSRSSARARTTTSPPARCPGTCR